MTVSNRHWQAASLVDADVLHELVREFYVEEKLVYQQERVQRAIEAILVSPDQGVVFLLRSDRGVHGYIAGAVCFSLEFGGRFVLLDEFYLQPDVRGQGDAKVALQSIEQWAQEQGIDAVRLEVNHDNEKALGIYLKAGFTNDERHILSKRLSRHGDPVRETT